MGATRLVLSRVDFPCTEGRVVARVEVIRLRYGLWGPFQVRSDGRRHATKSAAEISCADFA